MAVKIRLKRMGQKKSPFYRVVVALATAGEETAEHDAAVRWREGIDRDLSFVRDPESEAFTVLSARRDRGGARRFKRKSLCGLSAQTYRTHPVYSDLTPTRYYGFRGSSLRHHDAGEGRFRTRQCKSYRK